MAHQEVGVHKEVDVERGEFVARVAVVPDEDLDLPHDTKLSFYLYDRNVAVCMCLT